MILERITADGKGAVEVSFDRRRELFEYEVVRIAEAVSRRRKSKEREARIKHTNDLTAVGHYVRIVGRVRNYRFSGKAPDMDPHVVFAMQLDGHGLTGAYPPFAQTNPLLSTGTATFLQPCLERLCRRAQTRRM